MLRDERQREFADKYLSSWGNGILYLCPRFGKCRTSILILEELEKRKGSKLNILISYPNIAIKKSWEEEFEKMGYQCTVTYSTHLSLDKHVKEYDIVIVDEIHMLSENQIMSLQSISTKNDRILGLTGTMSYWTQKNLEKKLGLDVIAYYPMDKAIEEGVVTDYQINVLLVDLDNKVIQKFNNKSTTEYKRFKGLSFLIDKMEEERKETFYLRLARMRIIQNSLAKLNATKLLLKHFSDDRVLTFCGQISIAEQLPPCFHSKSKDREILSQFMEGYYKHMTVVKIGNMGSTYKPLNKVVINYFDSNSENLAQKINRCMGMEYDNPNKKAEIWMICSKEEVEKRWLSKSLEFFDKKKIRYYETGDIGKII